MPLPEHNPDLPDHINNSNQSPLTDFAILLIGVTLLVVLFTFLLMSSARWLAPLVPYQWERQLLAGASSTESRPEASAEADAMQELLERIVSQQPEPLEITLHWLGDEPTPNAFATAGGHIFVTRGLLQQVQSENGLAMVLAHEYAHIEARHPLSLMLEQMSLGAVMALLAGDASAAVTGHASLLTLLSFSRDMEREADMRALALLRSYYGHSRGADEFFSAMHSANETPARWQAFLQTHPLTAERLQTIRTQTHSGKLTPLPDILTVGQQP